MTDPTAAAERLRKYNAGVPPGSGDYDEDCQALAGAYLAEHAADDGELIDDEWWQPQSNDMGFIHVDEKHWLHWSPALGLTLDGPIEAMPLPDITTRGQLRLLLRALSQEPQP